jgi:hypothetical protein
VVIVTAMLAWFDEPSEELAGCVRSIAVVADRVLAVDGGYRLTPGTRPASPPDQAEAIREAAEDVALAHAVVTPDFVWDGQVQKRDFMLRAAAVGSDWLLAVDADWRLYGDRERIRDELAGLDPGTPAVEASVFTPPPRDEERSPELAPHPWHLASAGTVVRRRVLVRPGQEPRVEERHWWYSGVHGGVRRWLCGGDDRYPQAACHVLEAPFLVEHRCFHRRAEQLERNRVYCAERDAEVASVGFET